jgi:hypothetical protein
MGRFILIDFKKKEEQNKLRQLAGEYGRTFDDWVAKFHDDGTPPNQEQCATLEAEKITSLLQDFDNQAKQLKRVQDEVPQRKHVLQANLDRRKGRLFTRFSKTVLALQEQAASTMQFCLDGLNEYKTSLVEMLPTSGAAIANEFKKLMADCEQYIEASFPEGVSGLDSYDNGLPDGMPSYSKFKELVQQTETELKTKNADMIPKEIETLKKTSAKRFQAQINEAITNAMIEIEQDLSDDVTLPFLDHAAMERFRKELMASAKEYGTSRLDTSTNGK